MLCFSLFVGPASSLFEKSYYELMKKALKPGGIVCTQGISLHHFISDFQSENIKVHSKGGLLSPAVA